MEGLIEEAKKIRKRGCSPSSSTSSIIQNYKFKRAILAGKRGGGGGGSTTPVPTWRMVGSRSPSIVLRAAAATSASPRYPPSLLGRSRAGQGQGQGQGHGQGQPPVSARKLAATLWEMNEVPGLKDKRVRRREKVRRSLNSNSLPPHLSDPSPSPVSQRMERSSSGSHYQRREMSSSRTRRVKMDTYDSFSNASFMETETRSRCQTPSRSTTGARSRLKDVSSALTTSKELLKIITRMCINEEQPSSNMSLISALHAELERARLQTIQLIHDEHSDQKEINMLLKQFAEEKAAWKYKELSITGELEVERKLRKRCESINKKLAKELGETKASFVKAENQVRVGKIVVDKLRNGLETEVLDSMYRRRDGDLAFCQSEVTKSDGEDGGGDSNDDGGNSIGSDLNSIDFNMDDSHHNMKNQLAYLSRNSTDEELKAKKCVVSQVSRKNISLPRSMSGVMEWGNGLNYEVEKQFARRSCGDEMQGYRTSGKGVRDHMLPSSRLGLERARVEEGRGESHESRRSRKY